MSVPVLNIPLQDKSDNIFIKEGDTIISYDITVSSNFDMTDVVVECQLYDSSGRMKLDLSTENGRLSLDGQKIIFEEISADDNILFSGKYKGDLRFNMPNGEVWKPFNIIYNISKEYTI